METLPKDVLITVALEMNYIDILKWCVSSKYVNNKICKNEDFWKILLYQKYPNIGMINSINYRNMYKLLRETITIENVFDKPIFLRPEMIDFLKNVDFGNYSDVPISEILNLLLNQGILTRPILTLLFTKYLTPLKEDQYFHVDSKMNKYLDNYLTELEDNSFDRNKFTNKRKIIEKGIIPTIKLTDEEKQNLEINKKLASKLTEIVKRFFNT